MYVIKATLKKYNWGRELDVFFSFWYTGVFHSSLCSSFTIGAKDSSTSNMMKTLQWLITSLKIKSRLLSKFQGDLAFLYLCFILSPFCTLSTPWSFPVHLLKPQCWFSVLPFYYHLYLVRLPTYFSSVFSTKCELHEELYLSCLLLHPQGLA